jgi:molecular chaperone DnaK
LGGTKRIRIRLKATDPESLTRIFATNVDRDSVFLGVRGDLELGQEVRIDLQYMNGVTALSGEGRVIGIRSALESSPGGITIAVGWSADSRPIVERMLLARAAWTPSRGYARASDIPDAVSTEYASFGESTRDELGPRPIPMNAFNTRAADLTGPWSGKGPRDNDPTVPFVAGEDAEWGDASGEVTPLARIDLVRRAPFDTDVEDSDDLEHRDANEAVRSKASKKALPPKSRLMIGIDLGSTYSSAAIIGDAGPRIIPTRRGARAMPSSVTIFPGGKTIVGEPSLRQQALHPFNTIVGSKRLIGRPYHSPLVQKAREQFTYELVEGDEGEAAVRIGEHRISFEEIAGLVLKELREAARIELGEKVNRAVITCPAYYNERQREAVRTAGELAGLHVERILNEPTAAAINYALANRSDRRQRVLVYDLGGGTFDASLIEIEGDSFSVVATGGDNFLGGLDFDRCLVERLIAHIENQHLMDPREDPTLMVRLAHAAERAKRELSEREQTEIHIDHFFINEWAGPSLHLELSREEVEHVFAPLIDRTLEVCQDVLVRAKLAAADLDDVILVGGQSQAPIVVRRVKEMFGRDPKCGAHPEEAIAIGAAHYAHTMGSFDGLHLLDALPVSIGIGTATGAYQKIIERDARLPATATHQIATTRDGQSLLEIVVFQGEDPDVFNNELIGMLRMSDLPLAAAGQIEVTVTFELTEECILKLSATEALSGRVVASEFSARGTPAEIQSKLESPAASPVDPVPDRGLPDWLKTKLTRPRPPAV